MLTNSKNVEKYDVLSDYVTKTNVSLDFCP